MGLYGTGDNTGPTLRLNSTVFKVQGAPGISAYIVAVENGFVGTEVQWLASLVGPQGPQGIQGIQGETTPISSYIWLGTEAEYAALGVWSNNMLYFTT